MNSNVIIDLSPPHLIIVAGPDAQTFLQGQLTCDVRECRENTAIRGAYCNIQGKVIGNFLLFLHQTKYYLYFSAPIATGFLDILKKYAVFSKVTFALAPPDWKVYGVLDTLSTTRDEDLRITLPGSTPRELLFTAKTLECETLQTPPTWDYMDIENGIANITPETQTMFFPHELQYVEAGLVSVKKGCYLGQEIIARMFFKGKSKFALYRFAMEHDEALRPGEILNDPNSDLPVGKVVNVVGKIGLATLHHTTAKTITFKRTTGQLIMMNINRIYSSD